MQCLPACLAFSQVDAYIEIECHVLGDFGAKLKSPAFRLGQTRLSGFSTVIAITVCGFLNICRHAPNPPPTFPTKPPRRPLLEHKLHFSPEQANPPPPTSRNRFRSSSQHHLRFNLSLMPKYAARAPDAHSNLSPRAAQWTFYRARLSVWSFGGHAHFVYGQSAICLCPQPLAARKNAFRRIPNSRKQR